SPRVGRGGRIRRGEGGEGPELGEGVTGGGRPAVRVLLGEGGCGGGGDGGCWFADAGPFEGHGAPGEAAPEGTEEDAVAGLEAAFCGGFGEGNRDGGGGGVPVAVEVHVDLLGREVETVCHGGDDASVGLVGDDEVHVRGGEAGLSEDLERCFGHGGDGELEDGGAVHDQVGFAAECFAGAAGAGGVEQAGLAAV